MPDPTPSHRSVDGLLLLVYTLVCLVVMVFLTSLFVQWMAGEFGLSLVANEAPLQTIAERMQLRLLLLINNLGTWGMPAVLALVLAFRGGWAKAAGLMRPRQTRLVGYSLLVFILGMPLVGLAAYLNLQIDLPDWAMASEASGNALLASVLRFESVTELLFALLTVALVPAVAEELMFRGLIQGQLVKRVTSETAAIWIAAAIFSAIHLEFAGFLPRLLLGALLGYAYRWSGTLWMPIVLHFLFNGLQVVNTYRLGEFVPDTEMDSSLPTLLIGGAVSLVLVLYLGGRCEAMLSRQTEPT